jgi:hypothetical protein
MLGQRSPESDASTHGQFDNLLDGVLVPLEHTRLQPIRDKALGSPIHHIIFRNHGSDNFKTHLRPKCTGDFTAGAETSAPFVEGFYVEIGRGHGHLYCHVVRLKAFDEVLVPDGRIH